MNPDRLLLIAMYCVLAGVILTFAGNHIGANPNLAFLAPFARWSGFGLILVAVALAVLSKWREKQ